MFQLRVPEFGMVLLHVRPPSGNVTERSKDTRGRVDR